MARLRKPKQQFGTYTISRKAAATYVSGRLVVGDTSTFTISASVQPMASKERLLLPEGVRNTAAIKIFSSTELVATDEVNKVPGDRLTYNDDQYEVFEVDFHDHGIRHYECHAKRIPWT